MEKTREEKERLAQRCHELEMMVNLLQEEKSNISAEYEHLQVNYFYNKYPKINAIKIDNVFLMTIDMSKSTLKNRPVLSSKK